VAISDILLGIFVSTLQLSPLFLFAGMGEILAEKSGVINLGIEGFMLLSAFTMFAVDLVTGNPWVSILAAVGVGAVLGTAFGFLAVAVRVDQIVLGLAFYLFGLGFSFVLFSTFAGGRALPSFQNIPRVYIPYLSGIPFVGQVLFQQNVLVYVALLLVPATAYLLNRTSFGLRIRAVGENPKASDNMGINVAKVRFLAVLVGAMLAGLAGAYFEIGFLQSFQFDIILGRGFIALIMIWFANYGPYKALFVTLAYNIVNTGQSTFISVAGPAFQNSYLFFNMLPYVFIVALIPILGRRARPPKYLMKPYFKG